MSTFQSIKTDGSQGHKNVARLIWACTHAPGVILLVSGQYEAAQAVLLMGILGSLHWKGFES